MTETRGSTAPAARPPRPAPAAGGRGGRARSGPFARISLFLRQVVAELRKVIWPTRNQLVTYTTVALVFVLAMVAIVAGLDVAFAKGILVIFG